MATFCVLKGGPSSAGHAKEPVGPLARCCLSLSPLCSSQCEDSDMINSSPPGEVVGEKEGEEGGQGAG